MVSNVDFLNLNAMQNNLAKLTPADIASIKETSFSDMISSLINDGEGNPTSVISSFLADNSNMYLSNDTLSLLQEVGANEGIDTDTLFGAAYNSDPLSGMEKIISNNNPNLF